MAISSKEFKQALQNWASGITIVTTHSDSFGSQGMTVSSFSSVSMEPPQVLVCINQSVSTGTGLKESGVFTINILSSEQQTTSNLFANPNKYEERFINTPHTFGDNGAPLLTDSLASLECSVIKQIAVGTHWIVIGEIQKTHFNDGDPLLYYKAGYHLIQK
ncbi:MAG: flavin reductase family protein [Methylococcales bacterium]|nr:flavin reductase family protein [Methylococcales bacterium]